VGDDAHTKRAFDSADSHGINEGSEMEIEIVHAKANRAVCTVKGLSKSSTIGDVKKSIGREKKKYADINRQELRQEPRGKFLKDTLTLGELGVEDQNMLYFKDRGLQIGWTTVFLTEYAGPLLVYLWVYTRPWLLYGDGAASKPYNQVATLAAGCWTLHYAKRLLETMFVHRFSNATMPVKNIFINSAYYWGFAAFVAYNNCHPLYTAPKMTQVYVGLAGFLFCELGNLSIHVALRNLRPAGSKERKIPYATSNPFTQLFNFVSCPNYTYEVGAWVFFSIMSQSLPAAMFCFAGAYQMTMWALGKHKNYRAEFKDYPRRKAIVPLLL
jgi:very-long-chain enoyl-CoA reductase